MNRGVVAAVLFCFSGCAGGGGSEGEADDDTGLSAPEAPSNLVATAQDDDITLSWTDNSSDETGFRIYRRPAGEEDFSLAATVSANASGSWEVYTVDSGGRVGKYASIALDSDDNVHIGYYSSTETALKHASDSSGTRGAYVVDSSSMLGYYASIAVDSDDNIHISYYEYGGMVGDQRTKGDLKYATLDALK